MCHLPPLSNIILCNDHKICRNIHHSRICASHVQATWYVQFYSTSLCKNCQSEPLNWCNDSLICLVMSSNLKHTALNYIYLRGVAELRVFILPFHWIMPGCPNRVIQFVSSLFRSLTCATHLFNICHCDGCEMVSHCSFNLHFHKH